MKKWQVYRISTWIIAAAVLLACAVPFGVMTPPPPSAELMQTLIAATADSARLQTAAVLPTPTFTFTPTRIPTGTLMATSTPLGPLDIPALHTSTPTVDFVAYWQTRTAIAGSGGGGSGDATKVPIPKEWTCRVTEKTPPSGAVMDRGQAFTAHWSLLNTGTRTWPSNSVDIVFRSGLRNSGKVRQDLSTTVAPGGSVTVTVPLTAPKTPGVYNSIWQLRVGRTSFCQMKVTIEVK